MKKYKYYQSFSVSHLNKLVHCTLLNVPAKIKILLSSSPSIVTFNINNMPNMLWIIPPFSISPFLNGFIKFPQFIFLFSNLSSKHRLIKDKTREDKRNTEAENLKKEKLKS